MLTRIRAAIAVVVLGGAAFVALPATAGAATTPPTPSDLTVSPAPVIVTTNAGTTATFRFTTADTGSARLIDRNYRSVPLTVSGTGTYTATYTFTYADPPGVWTLEAKATQGGASSTATKLFEVHRVTDLTLDASPDVVARGSTIVLHGTLTYEEGGASKAYGLERVHLAFKPVGGSYSRVAAALTDARGRFSAQVKADKTGWWRAEFDRTTAAEPATSDSDRVDVTAPARATRITGFDASPEPVTEGGTLHLRGTLQAGGGWRWDGLQGREVRILFRPDGGYGWRQVATDRTDGWGRFSADVTARISGWWRAEYAGSPGMKGTASGTDHVTVTTPPAATRIVAFNAAPEPVKNGRYLSFRGALQLWDGGWEGYGHQKISIWFKKAGGTGWSYVKTTWTNGSGAFFTKTIAHRSGTWKAVFGGDASSAASSSKDAVRVTH